MFFKHVGRPDWPSDQFAAAVWAGIGKAGLGTGPAERAFIGAHPGISTVWWKVHIAALAIGFQFQHPSLLVFLMRLDYRKLIWHK